MKLYIISLVLFLSKLLLASRIETIIKTSRFLEGDGETQPVDDNTTDTTTEDDAQVDEGNPPANPEPSASELIQNIQNNIRANLIMKSEVNKRMLKKIAFDANRAKWILANQIDIEEDTRNLELKIFPKISQKLIKHAVIADFSYNEMKF